MKKKKNPSHHGYNLLVLSVAIILVAIGVTVRMGQISLFKKVNGVDLLKNQMAMDDRSSMTEARRGTIYDQSGQPIAMDATSYSLFAVLDADWAEGRVVKDIDYTASILAKYIDLPREEIWKILNQKDVHQVEFGAASKNLSPQTKMAIEAENLPGIHFTSKKDRFYFNDYFASHLIGYTESDPDHPEEGMVGALGIEASYDDILSASKKGDQKNDPLSGQDLYLTLDSRIQNVTEDVLDQAFKKYQPQSMGAYLVEVQTGKLLTAAQRPSFNLNTREGIDDLWQNLMVETANEPGSTIKTLTMAKAKERQVFSPGETYLSGMVKVFDREVRDYNRYGWGEISFEDGFARSSNVAMVELVKRMGDQNWVEDLKNFGFGQSTQSLLAHENPGTLDFAYPISRIMSGFGQAFSATPMQLMQAFTTIANHGEMLKIQFIDHVGDQPSSYQKISLGQKIDPNITPYILDLMVKAVEDKEGTAKPFFSTRTKVAAKTGTAEIANEEGTGYLNGPTDYYYSVVAFFPADQPQYMVYLFIKQPQADITIPATQMLAEVFHPLLETTLLNQ